MCGLAGINGTRPSLLSLRMRGNLSLHLTQVKVGHGRRCSHRDGVRRGRRAACGEPVWSHERRRSSRRLASPSAATTCGSSSTRPENGAKRTPLSRGFDGPNRVLREPRRVPSSATSARLTRGSEPDSNPPPARHSWRRLVTERFSWYFREVCGRRFGMALSTVARPDLGALIRHVPRSSGASLK
jgi:hypothetical protein